MVPFSGGTVPQQPLLPLAYRRPSRPRPRWARFTDTVGADGRRQVPRHAPGRRPSRLRRRRGALPVARALRGGDDRRGVRALRRAAPPAAAGVGLRQPGRPPGPRPRPGDLVQARHPGPVPPPRAPAPPRPASTATSPSSAPAPAWSSGTRRPTASTSTRSARTSPSCRATSTSTSTQGPAHDHARPAVRSSSAGGEAAPTPTPPADPSCRPGETSRAAQLAGELQTAGRTTRRASHPVSR